jgi:hypothetical protein
LDNYSGPIDNSGFQPIYKPAGIQATYSGSANQASLPQYQSSKDSLPDYSGGANSNEVLPGYTNPSGGTNGLPDYSADTLPDYSNTISDPVISSTLNQIVDTLSAYQDNLVQYDTGSRRRRKNNNNVFTASPKFNDNVDGGGGGGGEPQPQQSSAPQRIRAILAILEDATFDNSLESFVSKRDIEDTLEMLENGLDIEALKKIDHDLQKDEERLLQEIEIEQFFR